MPRRRRFTYWQEIAGVLCLKVVGLALLYFFFFAPADRPVVTQQAVAQHLLTAPDAAAHEEVSHGR